MNIYFLTTNIETIMILNKVRIADCSQSRSSEWVILMTLEATEIRILMSLPGLGFRAERFGAFLNLGKAFQGS